MAFKVTLFRVVELEKEPKNRDSMLITTTAAAASCENKRVLSIIASSVMERVENFKSNNPHFIVHVTSYMLSSRAKVNIPATHSSRYLENEKSITILHGSNGKKWVVYLTSNSTRLSVSLYKGWKDFASANQLQIGDVLVLEMMNDKPKAYKANIFRVAS